MTSKTFWYDISETGCYTEFKTKQEVIDHFNMMCDSDKRSVEGCLVHRQWSNSETLASYRIHFVKGQCRLIKC